MDNLDKTSTEILARNFDLETSNDFKLFREELVRRLSYLIKNDFEKLLWILYRIDVDEKQVATILSDKENHNHSENLADLIIQRQIQKAQTRIKYSKENEEGDLKN